MRTARTSWRRRGAAWIGKRVCAIAPLLTLLGCGRAPSVNILGSFFPVWLFCAVLGALLAWVVHAALKRVGWSEQLAPGLLVYPALATLLSLSIWLLFYS